MQVSNHKYIIIARGGSPSLVPRHSLTLPLDFVCGANIMHEKLKERKSLVQNHAHPWPFSIEFLPNHGWEGHGWAQFSSSPLIFRA